MSDRDDQLAELGRSGRRHGWTVTRHTLGYYKLRFARADDSVAVRVGPCGQITGVVADLGGQRCQLGATSRNVFDDLLAAPLTGEAR